MTCDHIRRDDLFRRTTLITLGLVLALIALGGAVRATDSGLACPDWPLCYGKIIPRQSDIPVESGYTLWNVWLEHTHRLVASVVGMLVVVLAVWISVARHHPLRVRVSILGALVAVIVQGLLGALVVLHLLQGELVTAHLGMSMVVVACLIVAGELDRSDTGAGAHRPSRAAIALAALVFVQLLVGSQVTGLHASLAYGLDPLRFHGELVPTSVSTAAEAYHLAHRLLAYVTAVAAFVMAAAVWRRHECVHVQRSPTRRRTIMLTGSLVVLVLVQITLGFANIWHLTPPAVVTAHLAVASWIWAVVVGLVMSPDVPGAAFRDSATPDDLNDR